uniref:coiled-coil domain-containing protein 175 n=1 Tax=Jaculus jaculus TaxID=51337 RepID=UPI001E1B59BE|nr:coiled-coil domain-containing protein 175 [Jaculus jaculus]
MALYSWSPEKGFVRQNMMRPASVSTSLSLELCTFPTTLGSSVAAAALEQLLVVEQSLKGDSFKCNEEMRTFLKDIAVAVKKLEEMRKNTIDLLEIESMELSRLYFLLETVPDSLNREMEECVRSARRLNISEINQMKVKIAKMDNEAEFLKKRIADLRDINETLGEKQEQLAQQHTKFVLALNHTMEEKATATMYINETYTRINFEKEEIALQKLCLQEAQELIEKHRADYTTKKHQMASQISMAKQNCDERRKEMYKSKRELSKLQFKMTKVKQTVMASTVVLSDHNLEIARLKESIGDWTIKVENAKKKCKKYETGMNFFMGHRASLDDIATNEKHDYLQKIKQVAEKLQRVQMENRELRKNLNDVFTEHNAAVKEEDSVYLRKRKALTENEKQMSLINQKEILLSQRKIDIKNMEEGFVILQDLYRTTKQVYKKQIKVLSDNLEREMQRCVIIQWQIASTRKKHARWVDSTKAVIQDILLKMENAEQKRSELLEETALREKEIDSFVAQIQALTVELKEEEKELVTKEKKLIQELSKFENLITKEEQISKEKEGELEDSLPQLHLAEEDYMEKHRTLEELKNTLRTQKQEEQLLKDYIAHFTRDHGKYLDTMDKVKQELKQLRDQETKKTQDHFEILRNLENEIYANDLKANRVILENKRLKKHLSIMKDQVEKYSSEQKAVAKDISDRSWELVAGHRQYSNLLAEFQFIVKELVELGEETLHKIKHLIDKLYYRDEKIESISKWLQQNIERLRSLVDQESPTELQRQQLSVYGNVELPASLL